MTPQGSNQQGPGHGKLYSSKRPTSLTNKPLKSKWVEAIYYEAPGDTGIKRRTQTLLAILGSNTPSRANICKTLG